MKTVTLLLLFCIMTFIPIDAFPQGKMDICLSLRKHVNELKSLRQYQNITNPTDSIDKAVASISRILISTSDSISPSFLSSLQKQDSLLKALMILPMDKCLIILNGVNRDLYLKLSASQKMAAENSIASEVKITIRVLKNGLEIPNQYEVFCNQEFFSDDVFKAITFPKPATCSRKMSPGLYTLYVQQGDKVIKTKMIDVNRDENQEFEILID